MSRCIACDKMFQEYEMITKNRWTREYEDMCRSCINKAKPLVLYPEVSYMDTPLLDSLPEGPKSFDD